ncbi:MAG: FtsW/RodA/SpoVE family cell cycle protein [Mucinivorans sp.]
MKKGRKLVLFRGDKPLWIIISLLCVVSLLVVYSSTASMAYREVGGDTSFYLLRQTRFILLGFFAIIVVHHIDIHYYIKFAPLLLKISVVLMLLAYVIGLERNEATRWITVPFVGLTFQPSDLLKLTLSMTMALALGTRQGYINRVPVLPSLTFKGWREEPKRNMDIFATITAPVILPILVSVGVIFPSNFSTSAILFFVAMVVLWVGRVRVGQIWRLIWIVGLTVVLAASVMKVLGVGRAETWFSRIESFVAPELGHSLDGTDFQKEQAQIAITSGGVFGKGPGGSTQRSQLPHPYSDFAYAFIIEEYGMVGGLVILALYLWIFYRAGIIMKKCTRPVGALLVLGLSLMITLSAFVHMVVSVGITPVTGQTLPIISLGGSSVFFTCISLGMILSVSRESDEQAARARAEQLAMNRAQQQSLEPTDDEPSLDEPSDVDENMDADEQQQDDPSDVPLQGSETESESPQEEFTLVEKGELKAETKNKTTVELYD